MANCPNCNKKPRFREDQIASFALSTQCLKQHHLKKGSAYIKRKKQLPNFHESVQNKATQMVESYIDVDEDDNSDSLEMSSAFFNIDLASAEPQFVTVHAIGKPPNAALDAHERLNQQSTYHTLSWEIGKDITEAEFSQNQDISGEVYVWYRWFGSSWTPKYVSRREFEQLRSVEK